MDPTILFTVVWLMTGQIAFKGEVVPPTVDCAIKAEQIKASLKGRRDIRTVQTSCMVPGRDA